MCVCVRPRTHTEHLFAFASYDTYMSGIYCNSMLDKVSCIRRSSRNLWPEIMVLIILSHRIVHRIWPMFAMAKW